MAVFLSFASSANLCNMVRHTYSFFFSSANVFLAIICDRSPAIGSRWKLFISTIFSSGDVFLIIDLVSASAGFFPVTIQFGLITRWSMFHLVQIYRFAVSSPFYPRPSTSSSTTSNTVSESTYASSAILLLNISPTMSLITNA